MEIDSIVNSLKTMSQVSNYKIYGQVQNVGVN